MSMLRIACPPSLAPASTLASVPCSLVAKALSTPECIICHILGRDDAESSCIHFVISCVTHALRLDDTFKVERDHLPGKLAPTGHYPCLFSRRAALRLERELSSNGKRPNSSCGPSCRILRT